jgi:ABC-type glycerol-3-phosphate transport system permease component
MSTALNTILFLITMVVGIIIVKSMSKQRCSNEAAMATAPHQANHMHYIEFNSYYALLYGRINSFKTKGESARMALTLPSSWQFSNYAVVIEQGKL